MSAQSHIFINLKKNLPLFKVIELNKLFLRIDSYSYSVTDCNTGSNGEARGLTLVNHPKRERQGQLTERSIPKETELTPSTPFGSG